MVYTLAFFPNFLPVTSGHIVGFVTGTMAAAHPMGFHIRLSVSPDCRGLRSRSPPPVTQHLIAGGHQ